MERMMNLVTDTGGKNEANGRQKRRKHSSSSETAIKIIPIVSSHYYTAVVVVCIRVEQWFKVCLHPCYSNANENQIFMVNKCICRRLGTRPFASMTARMILWWISWNITIKEMIVFSYLIVGVCVCVTDIRQRQCNSNVNINETLGSLKDTHTHTERKNNENVHNNSSNGISEFVAFIATPVHKNR